MRLPESYVRKLADLFVVRHECTENLANKRARTEAFNLNDPQWTAQLAHLHERYRRSEQDLKMFLCNIAANPAWYPECVMWMVDIQGFTAGDITQFLDDDVKGMARTHPDEFKEKLLEVGGQQMQEVRHRVEQDGHIVTDQSVNDGGHWLIGVPCIDLQAGSLCKLIHTEYDDEIDMGIITIRRMPWNLGIVGITNVHEAQTWLNSNPKT